MMMAMVAVTKMMMMIFCFNYKRRVQYRLH